ncbi:type II toxin-antitoxin system HipA family toxin [Pseudosulfitobacter koreensis]|uniref:Type II toxin-antitoxin system HipA family toxin n=1 Tax=Pseudosulfitobacter koreensis TaxID=2968472 RepID=A0ABT1Z1G0_9RHOB|nr:type II toxin-antitoxin system HipA family toxin [Pseudosulfitobacter koreense]MCR8826958.1 type II toxin-antitoxin system HipA family toxin [Pseudosulfitobacter koreense]
MMATRADVHLWGRRIGAVLWDDRRSIGTFEYEKAFISSKIEIAPLTIPLRPGPIDFPSLPSGTFHGLPGLLSDSLPDRFGNALINRWLAEQGRPEDNMDPVERLLYTGRRGMGALEFEPATGLRREDGAPVDIAPLVELANRVLNDRKELVGVMAGKNQQEALAEILRVGTSAGGARAKAVLAWNEETGEFHSGQLKAGPGYTQWLFKFDGVSKSGDHGLADPQGFGRLEFACYRLATEAGVEMMRSRLHHEGGRAHFMTQRFDRVGDVENGQSEKLHMLSLGALRHFDFNMPRGYSYEQALETIRRLGLGRATLEEMVRRAIVNVVIRNQDDHVKNIAFLMDKAGTWRLAPAYDVVWSHNPAGSWTNAHQMTVNGKADGFALEDLRQLGKMADLKPRQTDEILREVEAVAARWDNFVEEAEVPSRLANAARPGFRFFLSNT